MFPAWRGPLRCSVLVHQAVKRVQVVKEVPIEHWPPFPAQESAAPNLNTLHTVIMFILLTCYLTHVREAGDSDTPPGSVTIPLGHLARAQTRPCVTPELLVSIKHLSVPLSPHPQTSPLTT